MTSLSAAAFSDLTTCELEPIHIPGSVQAHGVLLACDVGSWRITHASSNSDAFGGKGAAAMIGGDLAVVLGAGLIERLTAAAVPSEDGAVVPVRLFGEAIEGWSGLFDVSLHAFDGRSIVEIEPSSKRSFEPPLDLVRPMLARLKEVDTLADLCNVTVQQLRKLIAYDRVMVYRFLADGSGQVVAEARSDDLEPLLHLRYPASDVPKQARELYKKNWVRLISDVDAEPARLVAEPAAARRALDLSFADLRSVSPIHIEYLKNMGVGASMSISLVVGGELWGLIACHHKTARPVGANLRSAAEVLGQVVSLQIQTVEGMEAYVTMRTARAMLDRVVAEFPMRGNLVTSLAARLDQLGGFLSCDGVGLLVDDVYCGTGEVPSADETRRLATFVEKSASDVIYSSHNLGALFALAANWSSGIRGVLAVPLSHARGDWLFFFRKELAQSISWGGDPSKAMAVGASGRLSPRKSFEAWKENVRGQSAPWTARERLIGETLRIYLLDVIVRFSEAMEREQQQSEQRMRMLASELNFRVKGTLELVQSLVAHGYQEPGHVHQFVRALEGRINAIALAHDASSAPSGSEVRTLFERGLAQQGADCRQFSLAGPEVHLDAKAYTATALVVHELVGNAFKTGALSVPEGRLDVGWHVDDEERLVVRWKEVGAPARDVDADELGLAIIRRNIPNLLGGKADLAHFEDGLQATFVVPAQYLSLRPAEPMLLAEETARPQLTAPSRPLAGYRVLVVEDQWDEALAVEQMLLERGAASVRVVGDVDSALQLMAMEVPDVVVLALDASEGSVLNFAEMLSTESVPFVLASRDGFADRLPHGFGDAPLLRKPYDGDVLAALLKDALLPTLLRAVFTGAI